MKREWSLDALYQGYQDKEYKKDKKGLEVLIREMTDFCSQLPEQREEGAVLNQAVEYMEKLELLGKKLSYYVYLRQSVNTFDNETANEINIIDKLISQTPKPLAILKKYISEIKHPEQYYMDYPRLMEYEYLLSEVKKDADYILNDDVEDAIARMELSAASAWSSMQSFLTSTLEVDYRDSIITLSEVRAKAHDKDAAVRKDAYMAEVKALEKIKDSVSYSLNSIKTQVNTICELRGYDSPLSMTLIHSKMKKETLEALLEAIRESLPAFHRYLKHKAKILGHENGLPWYDLFAPIGESSSKFSVEEAQTYLVRHFSGFSSDLADMTKEAFEKEWIDFHPRKGKVGGAFCENLPFIKQSRILTNFEGSLNDVVTLAHELGHAYHGLHIQEHLPLNVDYSMPVAETASTFNEALIMEAAINESDGMEKIALIESQLQDITQIICDIYSRYLFETEVFKRVKTGFLFADELKDIMLAAQKEAYGEGLNHDYLHPYMWVVKGHYYSADVNYYNFPYAFGGLLARGLYEKYKTDKDAFLPKYQSLLKSTTIMSVEEAAMQAEVNLEDPNFWRDSLKTVECTIEKFIKLA